MKATFRSIMMLGAALTVPMAVHAAALEVNGTCEVGNCSAVDTVSYGQSVAVPFNFNYVMNSDTYNVSGNTSASYGNNGSVFNAFMAVTYVGSGPSTGNDSLKIDVLQGIYDNSPGTWDGLYTETVPVTLSGNVGAGSTVSAQLFYDGQGVGLVGPYGPGSNYAAESANLSGLTGDTLSADYQFIFNFMAGTQPGAGAVLATSPVPEPGSGLLLMLVGGGFAGVGAVVRRLRAA